MPIGYATLSSLTKARQAQAAARIIEAAYGVRRTNIKADVIRYELVGSRVALAVMREPSGGVCVKVARRVRNGGVRRMQSDCRTGFASINEQIACFEMMYKRYGHR